MNGHDFTVDIFRFLTWVWIRALIITNRFLTTFCWIWITCRLYAIATRTEWFHFDVNNDSRRGLYPLVVTLDIWFLAEVAFSLYVVAAVRVLGDQQRAGFSITPKQRRDLLAKILAAVDDVDEYLRPWFVGQRGPLKRDNVREFVAWVFFGVNVEDVSFADSAELEEIVSRFEKHAGHVFPAGRSDQKCLKFTLDEVKYRHWPLALYLGIMVSDLFVQLAMVLIGFRKRRVGRFAYWHLDPNRADLKQDRKPTNTPIVLLHGLGAGMIAYVRMLRRLKHRCPSQEIFALELPHISMRIQYRPPAPKEEVVSAIETMLNENNVEKACFVGHSFGSICTTWMIRQNNERVAGCVFLDPVCFAVWEHDLPFNFGYRRPAAVHEWILWFAATEVFIAITIYRHFIWYDNVLLDNEIPGNSEVFLAGPRPHTGSDGLLNPNSVHDYLHRHSPGTRVHRWKDLCHAECLMHRGALQEITDAVARVSSRAD